MTRILVVDDDENLRLTIARDLRRQGFEVVLAASVDEALAALAAHPVDVLLTDLRMSGADGIDLLKAARLLSTDMRALLMSGFGTARDYQTAVDLGAVRVLCKPFSSAELTQAIQQAIECAVGFRGSVHGLALVDVLQMFHLAGRTVAIWIDTGDRGAGVVHLHGGALIHAELGDQSGEDALRGLLALRTGALRTGTMPAHGPRTIGREFQAVVLDALRTIDEQAPEDDWSLDDWELDPGSGPVAVRAAATPAAAQFAPALLDRLRAEPGYRSLALIDTGAGEVLAADGAAIDAASQAMVMRAALATAAALVPADRLEEVRVDLRAEYQILRSLGGGDRFLCLTLHRPEANPAMAHLALSMVPDGV